MLTFLEKRLEEIIAGIGVVVMCLMVFFQVVMRYVFSLPTYQTIKSYLGISKASINRSIKHLKKLKLLDVYRKYDRNIYHFH